MKPSGKRRRETDEVIVVEGGSVDESRYHDPGGDCPNLRAATEFSRADREDVEDEGYKPCVACWGGSPPAKVLRDLGPEDVP